MLSIETYPVGILKTNCYLIKDLSTGKIAIVDPGSSTKELDLEIESNKLMIEYILLTHGHFDHIKSVSKYKNITGAKVVACKEEEALIKNPDLNLSSRYTPNGVDEFQIDILLSDKETITLGKTKIELFYTPGHTHGSCCYILDNNIMSGDTLFKGEIGRTDLATGDYKDMKRSLKKLFELNGDYKVYPGHGDKTGLDFEKRNNRYFKGL